MTNDTAHGHTPSTCPTIIVDDDPAVRDSLRLLLESHGFAVVAYENAQGLLNRRKLPACGCLLIDVALPDLNGITLLGRLRARGSHLPAVMISGRVTPRLRTEAQEGGAMAVMEKPLSEGLLIDLVGEGLRQCGHYAADPSAAF